MLFAAEEGGGGLAFPPIENIVEWAPILFEGNSLLEFNKIGLIHFLGLLLPAILFFVAGRQKGLVPSGARNVAEGIIDFIETQVVMPTMGAEGMRYFPMLLSFFLYIFIGNITEVIPFFQMPANARMAGPLVLALVAWAAFIIVGVKHNGMGYFKSVLFPSGVPKALYLLVTPIEFLSTFIIRPFSHAVRLFANMLAGHILLVTFSVLCIGLWAAKPTVIVEALTFPGLMLFTAFEIGVSLIQAFVFTILASVYIGLALHPEH